MPDAPPDGRAARAGGGDARGRRTGAYPEPVRAPGHRAGQPGPPDGRGSRRAAARDGADASGRRRRGEHGAAGSRQRELARARNRHRHARLAVLICVVLAAALAAVATAHTLGHKAPARPPAAARGTPPRTAGSASATPAPTRSVAVPQTGPGTFVFAAGTGPVLGTSGTLRRFRVAVEDRSGLDAAAFAAMAEQTLGDRRSWIAGGDVRFQRVPQTAAFDFTLYLATPGTTDKMCGLGGIHVDKYASCRLPGQVIINLARWLTATPDYHAPLLVYQQFALNHEIGRELGRNNEACPGPGQLAPVMQNQTLGLNGCVPNSWPYVGGTLYSGSVLP